MKRLLAGLFVASSLALVQPQALSAPADAPAFVATKTVSRSFFVNDVEQVVDSREVTVTADQTTQLRGRERVRITWSGAHPSGGRATTPYGEGGLNQEYPVVILQCRGRDDASLPAAEQLSPETCWTTTRMQRSQSQPVTSAVWLHDHYAAPEDRLLKSGMSPFPDQSVCPDPVFLATHLTEFVAANGTVYPACTSEKMPPEAAVGAAFPAAEVAAFTALDGTGSVMFEVRSEVENESLGCAHDVECSVVVIPIMGVSCDGTDRECRRSGQFRPGSSNFANSGVDLAVSPSLWWTESNWRNRIVIPIDFALPPDTCDVADPRPPVGFGGSELISQATLQWAPAYCLSKKRFKLQHNKMPDQAAFGLLEAGDAPAAFVSGPHEVLGENKVAYAPTAISGFGIGYIIDLPDNQGEYVSLKLNPRLLAKMMSQSYLGSDLGRGHPGIEGNPLSINQDPEFIALNPGLDQVSREAAANMINLSEASDVVTALTAYIADDPAARAFLKGKPDEWGMVVNPSYLDIEIPTDEWPLLDTYVPQTQQECLQQNPAPYFTQLAAPVTSLRKIAESILDSWPNVQTKCDRATQTDPWKVGRVDRQGVGSRFLLGVVSLGDAERLGLNVAALETKPGNYVTPTLGSLADAVKLADAAEVSTDPFVLPMQKLRDSRTAYPGTLVIYTASLLTGLEETEAETVAKFIRIATTEGQRPGRGNGELPAGYLPLTKTGPTAALWRQAQSVADAVEAQEPESTPDNGPGGSPLPGEVPTDEEPGKGDGEEEPPPVVAMPNTQLVSSRLAQGLLPALVTIGVAAAVLCNLLVLSSLRRRR